MTAQEAHKLADDIDGTMAEIYSKIKEKCLQGEKYLYLDIKNSKLGMRIWKRLLEDGYDVMKSFNDHDMKKYSYDSYIFYKHERQIIGLHINWYNPQPIIIKNETNS